MLFLLLYIILCCTLFNASVSFFARLVGTNISLSSCFFWASESACPSLSEKVDSLDAYLQQREKADAKKKTGIGWFGVSSTKKTWQGSPKSKELGDAKVDTSPPEV